MPAQPSSESFNHCVIIHPILISYAYLLLPVLEFFKKFIDIQLIHNVVLISIVQQSQPIIHIHIPTLVQICFLHRSLESSEQSSLCYTLCCIIIFIKPYLSLCDWIGQEDVLCLWPTGLQCKPVHICCTKLFTSISFHSQVKSIM